MSTYLPLPTHKKVPIFVPILMFDFFFRIFELTDILCVNESEAQIILGREKPIETEEDIEEAMKNLLKKCHTIIITLGRYSFNIFLFFS